jgi:hypothetical protein
MSIRAVHRSVDRVEPRLVEDRDSGRVLTLLQADQSAGLTIGALRERGVEAPAQAIYSLQLAGYEIDRVVCEHPSGHRTSGYRLRARPRFSSDSSARLKEVPPDDLRS